MAEDDRQLFCLDLHEIECLRLGTSNYFWQKEGIILSKNANNFFIFYRRRLVEGLKCLSVNKLSYLSQKCNEKACCKQKNSEKKIW